MPSSEAFHLHPVYSNNFIRKTYHLTMQDQLYDTIQAGHVMDQTKQAYKGGKKYQQKIFEIEWDMNDICFLNETVLFTI